MKTTTKTPKNRPPKPTTTTAASIETAPATPPPAPVTGSKADYLELLPAAMRIPASELISMRADPQLAFQNTRLGVASVIAVADRASALSETDITELASLEEVALAVVYASTQVAPIAAPTALQPLLARGHVLRALLLNTAETLVLAGRLPKADVEKIRAGKGKLDTARDLIELSSLFEEHATAIAGKHPVTPAEVREASEVGTELVRLLKPSRFHSRSSAPAPGTDERDRLWTLLVQGHDRLWRAAAYLFGKKLADKKVPPLQAEHRRVS